jgi:hypothetical protein
VQPAADREQRSTKLASHLDEENIMTTRYLWYVMLAQGSTLTSAQIIGLAPAGPPQEGGGNCDGPSCPNTVGPVLMGATTCACIATSKLAETPPHYRTAEFYFSTRPALHGFRAAVIVNLAAHPDYKADLIIELACLCSAS